jgi:hypothetical protein
MKKQLFSILIIIISFISLASAHEGPGKPHQMHLADWIILILIIIIIAIVIIFLIKRKKKK